MKCIRLVPNHNYLLCVLRYYDFFYKNKVISINGETFFQVSKTIVYTFLNSGDMKCPKTFIRSVRSILCKSQLLLKENKLAKRINDNSSIANTIQNLSAQHAHYPDDDLASTVTRDYTRCCYQYCQNKLSRSLFTVFPLVLLVITFCPFLV